MNEPTTPAPSSTQPIAPVSPVAAALVLYDAVARGTHSALKPARVPS